MATNTKTKKITPERKAYKAEWMRRFRAKQRGPHESDVAPDPKKRSQLTQVERIAMLERELASLKAEAGLPLNIDYTSDELRQMRIEAFEQDLVNLNNCSNILTLKAKVAEADKEFEAIRQGGDWFSKEPDRAQINRHRTRLHEMEAQAEFHEQMIVKLGPGGRIRAEKMAGIAADRVKASGQISSQDPHEQRLGIALLNGCDKAEGELEVALGRHKAELKRLRE